MRYRTELFFGSLLLLAGVAFLLGTIFQVNVWDFCWPIGLILVGVWILLRPRLGFGNMPMNFRPFGGVRRSGAWQVIDEEVWMFLGDIRLNFAEAQVPSGETSFRFFGFIGDIDVLVPQGVGVALSAAAFINDTKVFGQKRNSFFFPVYITSDDYSTAERKILIETYFFIGDIDIKRL